MTALNHPVRRETYSQARERGKTRPIVVELHPTYVRVKLKGNRRYVTVTYDQLWTLGNRNAAESARKERLEKRKQQAREKRNAGL
jgi:hypothetical protein